MAIAIVEVASRSFFFEKQAHIVALQLIKAGLFLICFSSGPGMGMCLQVNQSEFFLGIFLLEIKISFLPNYEPQIWDATTFSGLVPNTQKETSVKGKNLLTFLQLS